MISIRANMSELEKLESLHNATRESYASAIDSIRQYAVEVEASSVLEHRASLAAIAAQFSEAHTKESVLATRSAVRNVLRDYHAKATKYISGMREELIPSARAFQEVVNSITRHGSDQEGRLKENLGKLKSVVECEDLRQIRAGVRDSISAIEGCIRQLKEENRLVLAQMRDEIRNLHKRVAHAEQAAAADAVTGLPNRQEMESRISREVQLNRTFSLLVIWLPGLKQVAHIYGRHLCDEVVVAFCKRLRNGVGPKAISGRWSDDEFVSVLPLDKPGAIKLSKTVTAALQGDYVFTEDGQRKHVSLRACAGVLDHQQGEDKTELLRRAEELLRVIEEA